MYVLNVLFKSISNKILVILTKHDYVLQHLQVNKYFDTIFLRCILFACTLNVQHYLLGSVCWIFQLHVELFWIWVTGGLEGSEVYIYISHILPVCLKHQYPWTSIIVFAFQGRVYHNAVLSLLGQHLHTAVTNLDSIVLALDSVDLQPDTGCYVTDNKCPKTKRKMLIVSLFEETFFLSIVVKLCTNTQQFYFHYVQKCLSD